MINELEKIISANKESVIGGYTISVGQAKLLRFFRSQLSYAGQSTFDKVDVFRLISFCTKIKLQLERNGWQYEP